jgi:F-type H+-transporting ATPase subunit a
MSQQINKETQNTETPRTTEGSAGATFAPPTIYSETIAHVGSFEIRNTLIMSWISVIFLCIVAWKFIRGYRENSVPTKFQALVETVIEGLYDFFHSVTQDAKQTRLFLGICGTIFLYVVISNWFGIFPGVGPIGIWEEHEGREILVPLLRSTYSDVNMTLAIAMISVVMTQVYGMMALGFRGYWGKFFLNPFKDPIGAAVGILELVSEMSKIISFTFRLYGNIFAGEVLLAVIGFLAPYAAPLPFYGLELFVGLVQGLVFSLLTLVFFKMGATGHGSHEEVHSSAHKPATVAS